MFYWRSTLPSPTIPGAQGATTVELAFTGRAPGRGAEPYGGFNLGGHVGDDPGLVESNRRALARALTLPRERVLFMNQVHGDDTAVVAGPWPGPTPQVDALVSAEPDLALAVLVADCVPVLLHDSVAGVVGAVHAGRPGLMAGIVIRAVERMRGLGALSINAVVGPSVCGRCYEVPEALAARAASVTAAAQARSWVGTPAIDVAAGVVQQLATEGVPSTRVAGCTREHDDLYSYRRDRITGRFAGVVVMRRAAAS